MYVLTVQKILYISEFFSYTTLYYIIIHYYYHSSCPINFFNHVSNIIISSTSVSDIQVSVAPSCCTFISEVGIFGKDSNQYIFFSWTFASLFCGFSLDTQHPIVSCAEVSNIYVHKQKNVRDQFVIVIFS